MNQVFPAWSGATQADSLRTILDSVFAAPAYHWVERPNPLAFLVRWWRLLGEWLARMQDGHPDFFWVLFWALVGLLALILIHAASVMVQTLRAAAAPAAVKGEGSAPEVRGPAWFRREAQRLAARGLYPEAMQADFLALVLELDARKILRFHPSKTPSEYTREAKLPAEARDSFRALVRTLYGYAFARVPCGPEEFAAWGRLTSPERYASAH